MGRAWIVKSIGCLLRPVQAERAFSIPASHIDESMEGVQAAATNQIMSP